MFVRLKDKPFYFLTDRETKYTFLVDNRAGDGQRHLYLPDQFETMTSKEVREYKWRLVYRLMWWGMVRGGQMTTTDRNQCLSKVADFALTLATGLFCGSFLRRILFRIEFPFLEMALQRSAFSSRWLKSLFAYSTAGVMTYQAVSRIMKEEYLVDLAFEYRYNFERGLTCRECDPLLDKLCS